MIRTPSLFGLQRFVSRLTGAAVFYWAGTITADRTRTLRDITGNEVVDSYANIFSVDQTFSADVYVGGAVNGQAPWLSTASGSTYTADFARGQTRAIISALAVGCTISTANLTAGRDYQLIIKDNGSTQTLTFPGTWNWNRTPPTGTTVGKFTTINLISTGNTDAAVIADWAVTV